MIDQCKVCIFSSVHMAFDTRILHKQAKTLARAGYDVTLIAQNDKDEVIDGVKIIGLPSYGNRMRRILGTWHIINLVLKQKAHFYHFHDPELLPAALLLKVLTRARVIYDVHEDVPKDILTKSWLPPFIRKTLAYLTGIMEKKVSSRLDYVVSATDSIGENFKGVAKVVTINNYPIVQQFNLAPLHSHGQPAVIYTGLLCEERGIGETVRAMAYLDPSSNARLKLYGKFYPAGYFDIIAGLDGFAKVQYFGWVSQEALWQKMGEANMGIVCFHPDPNHVNAMPTKLFEYMVAGLPVVASNFPLWKDIVSGNNCGLNVDPFDPMKIALAIQYLIDHPVEARQMGENGRRAALEMYNWENESKKLLVLYNMLLANR